MSKILLGFLEEVKRGSFSATEHRRLAEEGGYAVPLHCYTDSYSIWSYLKAQHAKLPADKGTFFHLAYLREQLSRGIAKVYWWVDTRDMFVDGMTKGALDRAALVAVMRGRWKLNHEPAQHP